MTAPFGSSAPSGSVMRTVRLAWLAALACASAAAPGDAAGDEPRELRIAVMDPLAAELACPCVQGHAQRRYDRLATFLAQRLRRPVPVAYGETLAHILRASARRPDLIIGKQSVVRHDVAGTGIHVRPIAMLTDKDGSTALAGWFVVRQKDPARSIAELKDYRILFGPRWADEKHAAALAILKTAGVPLPGEIRVSPGCSSAALAVADSEADVALISSYAFALLEGCGTIEKGALRIVGQTGPVPFITVFATESVTPDDERALVAALLAVRGDGGLLVALESRDGFVRMPPAGASDAPGAAALVEWTDWRGPGRDGLSQHVPSRLPSPPRFLWRRSLSGVGLSGVAATARHVIVADKDAQRKQDLFRCLAADSGEPLWVLAYDAPGEMDYSNSPRAAPVIHDGRVYLLGAFGHLHCVRLDGGEIVWRRNLLGEFGGPLVTWGLCSTPLIVDDLLIVNPGAADAALVALDRRTGGVVWKSPGRPAAYASFIVGTFGGVRQLVGYDAESLGGWDPQTGRRLWELVPEGRDFNVPTPVNVSGKLLVATENNGTRLYGFDEHGRILPKPLAENRALKPDASTPVVLDGLVFGCARGLFCLDLRDGLRTRWRADDDAFDDYASLIAGNGHVLVTTTKGELLLVRASGERYEAVSRVRVYEPADVWSHPALVGDRLYVRNTSEIACIQMGPP